MECGLVAVNRDTPNRELVLDAPLDDAMLSELVARVTQRFPDACVTLFGSRACGTPRSDSDLDMLVVASSEKGTFASAAEVYRALRPRRIAVDVVFITPEQFRERCTGFDPFLREIVEKGRVLCGNQP